MQKLPRRNPFSGFKHICVFGLGMGGVDAEIRTGLTKFRGQSRKWLLHDLGRYSEQLDQVEAGALGCDVFVGHVNSEALARRLKRFGKPVLNLSPEFGPKDWLTHHFDYRAVGRMAAEHYLELKYHNFAFLSLRETRTDSLIWEGFQDAVASRAAHLAWIRREVEQMTEMVPKERIVPYPSHGEKLLAMDWPTAMLAHSDGTAASVATLAFFLGISVPEELSILGIGDMVPVCESCHPSLSSIQLPGEKLGYLAGEHVEALFDRKKVERIMKLSPARLVKRRSTGRDAVRDPVVAKALALMRHNATNRMTIGDMVAQLPISKRGFNDRFTRVVGRTPREELERIRLGIARERLLATNDTVLHIALDCGFADVDAMVRSFKRRLGMTPTQFRKQHRL